MEEEENEADLTNGSAIVGVRVVCTSGTANSSLLLRAIQAKHVPEKENDG